MNRATLPLMLASTLLFSALASAQPAGGRSAPRITQPSTAQKSSRTVLFFINPHGQPCQMQDRIITDNAAKIKARASVRYVKTTEEQSYPLFQKYGVRGLPMLIVVDERGSVVHRFTPGIRGIEEILGAL